MIIVKAQRRRSGLSSMGRIPPTGRHFAMAWRLTHGTGRWILPRVLPICMLEAFPLVNVNTWFGLWYYFIFFPVLGMESKTHSMRQILRPSPILVLLVHANLSVFLVSIPVHIDQELIAARLCVQLLGLMRMKVLSDLWEIHEYVSFNKVQHLRLQCSLAPDSVPTKIMNINL